MKASTEIRQKAIALLERLPEAMLDEAVQLLESLHIKADQFTHIKSEERTSNALDLNSNQPIDTTIPWAEVVRSLAGVWKEDFPTLEDIRAESGHDIVRESL